MNIIARMLFGATGRALGQAAAPVTSRIPWVVRMGCAFFAVAFFFLALLILGLAVA